MFEKPFKRRFFQGYLTFRYVAQNQSNYFLVSKNLFLYLRLSSKQMNCFVIKGVNLYPDRKNHIQKTFIWRPERHINGRLTNV